MNAVLAIIADGGRAIVEIYTEGEETNYFSFILLILLKPFDGSLVQPLAKRLPGVGYSSIKTMPLEGETAPSWWVVGMFVFLCLASKSLPSWSFCSRQNVLEAV
jgi:hypothetical protein